MKNNIDRLIKFAGIFLFSLWIFSSCVPIKEQIYLQVPEGDSTSRTYYEQPPFEYKLNAGNNLYVKISSIDDEVNEMYGKSRQQNIQDASLYLMSYAVSDSGFIDIPYIGKIYVKDLTVREAKKRIEEEVNKKLKFATVVVKLVNYNLSVLGEVKRPAMYKIYQERVNVFEALAMAGDMNIGAKRDDVIIIRKTPSGVEYHHVNLLEDKFLQSKYYYLMPGDIVYVQPVKNRNYVFASAPYALILSTISTMVLIATFVINNKK
jgi:polysaccharide export outer membrane protein